MTWGLFSWELRCFGVQRSLVGWWGGGENEGLAVDSGPVQVTDVARPRVSKPLVTVTPLPALPAPDGYVVEVATPDEVL